MAAPRKYPEGLRERAIGLTLDARKDPVTRSNACRRIGEQFGINPETLSGWVVQAEIDGGRRPEGTTSDAKWTTADVSAALFMVLEALRSAKIVEAKGARFTLLVGYVFVMLGFSPCSCYGRRTSPTGRSAWATHSWVSGSDSPAVPRHTD